MLSLTSSASALAADRAAEDEFGYEPWLLMEEAGIRLQDHVERLSVQGTVVYLAGSGNNGGDALVMARQAFLRGHTAIAVVQVFEPSSPACRLQNARAVKTGVPIIAWPSETAAAVLSSAALWVDGVWGTGLKEPLRTDRAAVLASLEELRSQLGKPVLAIDVPSGLWEGWTPGEPALKASRTLAPGWMKDFCYYPAVRELCGELQAVELAFPLKAQATAQLAADADLKGLLPRVARSAHKGRRGHVAVVGGSAGMTGAAVLAARSAAAAGAGLVTLGCDADVIALIAPQVPAFQVRPATEITARAARLSACVVGPGWGAVADRPALFESLWNTELPLVIDADGLAVWNALKPPLRVAPVVLTPHPGEFARLAQAGTRADGVLIAAARLAEAHGLTVVLKGAVTWVIAPDGRRGVWDGANPALGTGGSGDCLAGVVGALLAQGLDGFDAALAAVALHGAAGRALASSAGWFTAEKLPEAIAQMAAACMADSVGL